MKKYLLLLGCACLALAVLADDSTITKVSSSDLIGSKDIIAEKVVKPTNPIEQGGKPRRPKSSPVGGPSIFANMVKQVGLNIVSGLVHIGDEVDPNGGKPRTPKGIDGCTVRPGKNTGVASSSGDGSGSSSSFNRVFNPGDVCVTNGGKGRIKKGGLDSWRPGTGNGPVIASPAGGNTDKMTIGDVTTLIDQLLKDEANGKSIGDVTMMIDQILTNPKD